MYLILRVFTDSREGVENAIGEAVTGIAVLRRPHIVAVAVEHCSAADYRTEIVKLDILLSAVVGTAQVQERSGRSKLLFTDLARQLVGVCSDLLAVNVLHFVRTIDRDLFEGLSRLIAL